MLDLITEVENNKSDKLKEQLNISRQEIESITVQKNEESKAKESL
jgi:hypothetical protein